MDNNDPNVPKDDFMEMKRRVDELRTTGVILAESSALSWPQETTRKHGRRIWRTWCIRERN
jgi:hypothetical protein